jgi:hemerythrin superfamily protein
MARMIANGIDVVYFLKEQHEQIKQLFSELRAANGPAKEAAFFALRRLLAVHETAEEEIVHPAARRALPDGDSVVDARLLEENEAKQSLSKLEGMEIDSAEFKTELNFLERSVLTHARAEEQEEFNRLGSSLDQDRLERMRTAAEFAERMAPTRPHPGVESAAANLLLGPFAAMLDRARDALSNKTPSSKTPS